MSDQAQFVEDQLAESGKSQMKSLKIDDGEVLLLAIHHPEAFDGYWEAFKGCMERKKEAVLLACKHYYEQFNKPVPQSSLLGEIKYFAKGGDLEMLESFIPKLYESSLQDPEYVKSTLSVFLKQRRAQMALHEAADLLVESRQKNNPELLDQLPAKLAARMKVSLRRKGNLTCLNDVAEQQVEWLWYPYIPLGKITLLEGDPSCGKTFLALAFCKMVTNGETNGGQTVEPRNVLFMTAEDGLADTIKPRFVGMGGDPSYFHAGGELPDGRLMSMSDTDVLESIIEEIRPKLVVIDPLSAFLGADVDMHRANEVRPVMAGLGRLAEKYQMAVIVIRHLNKGTGKASYRGQGSIDFTALSRSVLLVGANPDNPSERAFIPTKSSLAEKGCAQKFIIKTNLAGSPELEFKGDCDLTADDLLAVPAELTKSDEAESFLESVLKDGPKSPKDVRKLAKDLGIGETTLQSAKRKLGINAQCVDKKNSEWVWILP